MTDIHTIIAAAKRFEHCDVTNCCNDPEGGKALMLLSGYCIAMAEALARIAQTRIYAATYESAILDMEALQDIARECLERIVKEANP